ncbi:MAG: hypothetical protein H6683_00100 [Deltaproteobacteria bacterium]|nr:hypothetical protein [Deltaproteobacteria bacterium]
MSSEDPGQAPDTWVIWTESKEAQTDLALLEAVYQHKENQAQMWLDMHSKYATFYTFLLAAIVGFGANIVANNTFHVSAYSCFLVPIAIILLLAITVQAKRTTFRFYQRYMESVSIYVKIESALGLYDPIRVDPKINKSRKIKFAKDASLFPSRIGHRNYDKTSSTEEFLRQNMFGRGAHGSVSDTFSFIQAANYLLFLAWICYLLLGEGELSTCVRISISGITFAIFGLAMSHLWKTCHAMLTNSPYFKNTASIDAWNFLIFESLVSSVDTAYRKHY